MAEIIEILLKGDISPEQTVIWLTSKQECAIPEVLQELESIKQEFIPYFLNYLRDHTLPLLQSSKSATPSPAKTPSLKKFQKSGGRKGQSSKRQQLFGASPAGDTEDVNNLSSSVFSPNVSLDSPGLINHKGDRRRSGYSSQKSSPQCGSQRSPYVNQTPEQQRSKQKLSLGEFITTPDQASGSQSWKKKSPHSAGRRDISFDSSPSTGHGRKSGGRRKHASSPLIQNFNGNTESKQSPIPPVFSLNSAYDFPAMDEDNSRTTQSGQKYKNQSKSGHQAQKKKTPVSHENRVKLTPAGDNVISREINFSQPESTAFSNFASNRLQEVKNTSNKSIENKSKPVSGPRRITPTIVKGEKSVPQNSVFLVPIQESDNKENDVTVFSQSEICEKSGLDEERELLKQEKERWKSLSQTSDCPASKTAMTPRKPSFEQSTSVVEIVEAVPAEVTYQDRLDLLIALYSRCLTENLFPNVIVELYFLVQLLTARGSNGADLEDLNKGDIMEANYFSSVHNTVYFAVSVLEEQKRLLSLLDRGTLRLLIENPRITAFSLHLKLELEELYDRIDVMKGPAFPRSPIGSVSFQADTDNRMNFPSDRAFHVFKRQRDGFYELLREWEASRMNPNYNMAEVFGSRVRSLVGMGSDLVNLIHFSRLFQSQLLAMCKGDGGVRSSEDEENIALLSQLKRSNPEKFKKLQERFIKPLSFGGPCPSPSFPGCQEFFRDFIKVASNPLLNQHLSDTFTAKLQELDETSFTDADDDENASSNGDDEELFGDFIKEAINRLLYHYLSDTFTAKLQALDETSFTDADDDENASSNGRSEEKDVFRAVLMNLRLIGKFLGFVTFLPYQSTDRVPESMESTYVSIRNKHPVTVDMMLYLRSAVKSGRLTLTVPWVVEYLSMMDKMAPRLDHLQMVLLYLLYIQRYIWVQFQDDYSYSTLLIVALISWLFENPVMPDGFFFSEIPENLVDADTNFPSLAALDNRDFVDQSLFYTCCPYIGEMKALLVEFAVGTSSKTSTIRKITPVSADVAIQKSMTERQLQLQMEENFFHNHPASMKRVVDFVADRTASNFIKKFRSKLLHDSIAEGKDKIFNQLMTTTEGSPVSKLKDKITVVTKKIAQEILYDVRNKVNEDAPRYCSQRTLSIIELLLPDDQSSVVVTMAADISKRVAMEKISHWMAKNITVSMYQTEIIPDIEKISRALQTRNGFQCTSPDDKPDQASSLTLSQTKTVALRHDDSIPHPSEVLIDLKDMVKSFVLKSGSITEGIVYHHLQLITQVFQNRQDLLPPVCNSFCQLTVELLLGILLHEVVLYTEELISAFVTLWKTHFKDSCIYHIFSGRVIQSIQYENKDAWNLYAELLLLMFRECLLQPSQVQDACLKFLPNIQDIDLITNLCRCLCTFTSIIPESERAETLGSCLELIYNMLPEPDCELGKEIVTLLGVHENNNMNNVKDKEES